MNVLVIETPYESADEMEALYSQFTDAEVDVEHASEIDVDEISGEYDTVLSEVVLDENIRGDDVLDKFDAERKALYTAWRRDEADLSRNPGSPRSVHCDSQTEKSYGPGKSNSGRTKSSVGARVVNWKDSSLWVSKIFL